MEDPLSLLLFIAPPLLLIYKYQNDVPLTYESPLDFWHGVQLSECSTTREANNKRCAAYQKKAATTPAYLKGPRCSRRMLLKRRKDELDAIYQYPRLGKSHRTVVAMVDSETRDLLIKLRRQILAPLFLHDSLSTQGNWCPSCNIIPGEDLHITVAVPWWWHSLQPNHEEISREMGGRLRQTVMLGMHHPFQCEVDRIVLLGGRVLVALFRTCSERGNVTDRSSTNVDAFVRLRRELVRCFTEQSSDGRRQPLTHGSVNNLPSLRRAPSIELKTPGMEEGDGFIHCTLARLPHTISAGDTSLEDVLTALDECNALCSGHRMEIDKLRFLHSEGRGGNSNPMYKPLYDEYIEFPKSEAVKIGGQTGQATIGAVRDITRASLKDSLFAEPPPLKRGNTDG
ncbi:hypothetical protein TrCOL_g10875 [Triparma columacea]|uniref:Uncharacterized protein n=1 Tax=Triparma columacea TaxID=722753 RepID=A0A9W7FZX3_9STRA|nr:hypothetical protein TrCOL_g10875 [Triparma columacea]